MKPLTKDDFDIGNFIVEIAIRTGHNGDDLMNQILKNQEDAERWTDYVNNRLSLEGHNMIIVERLKKRIEEDYMDTELEIGGIVLNEIVVNELQKILGKEK